MNILLIGSGGREHAIARQLLQSPLLSKLYVAPGNAGTAEIADNVPISETDISGLLNFALTNKINLTIVGPEAPLVLGITDQFESHGLKIVGPNREAAQLEGSKKWAKDKMVRYGIPTAAYETFTDPEKAIAYIDRQNQFPIVIKADGLAAGKGVVIAQSRDEAQAALNDAMVSKKFSDAGATVVIEQFLQGEEASIFAFTDGKTVLPMVAAQDHKAIFDGDKGPNTGGMGAYSPAPIVTPEVAEKVNNRIFQPLIAGFQKDRIEFKGILFAGLMIHNGEPIVIEFNARFGDPETQVVIPRLKTDLVTIFDAIANRKLDTIELEWRDNAVVCVVIASKGYPDSYEKGFAITGLKEAESTSRWIIHAGTKKNEKGEIVTNGGRVLGVVGQADELKKAIDNAYEGIKDVRFDGAYYRRDIGAKGIR
ncbi:phosphoribosylamine--glycine ligase [bacterium]|nr:phosphoribosylamine--glycine ligase [bacterium]